MPSICFCHKAFYRLIHRHLQHFIKTLILLHIRLDLHWPFKIFAFSVIFLWNILLSIPSNKLCFCQQAVQFHFHWGKAGGAGGSEHTLDGSRYFAEMHIVHYNTQHADISVAAKIPQGLAVLGFFIKVCCHRFKLKFHTHTKILAGGARKCFTKSTQMSLSSKLKCRSFEDSLSLTSRFPRAEALLLLNDAFGNLPGS